MSVGDAHFKKKATQAFKDRISTAKVIMVTHSMGQVRQMCDYVLLVQNGKVIAFDDIEDGIKCYQQ